MWPTQSPANFTALAVLLAAMMTSLLTMTSSKYTHRDAEK